MKKIHFSLLFLILATASQSQVYQEGFHIPGTFPTAAAFGDINGDGHIDFVQTYNVYEGQSNLNATRVWINNGDATFTAFGEFGTAQNEDVKLADIDNDGDLDAVTSSKIFKNDGTGIFSDGQGLGSNVWAVEVADFNEDGFLDVFCAVYSLGVEDRLYLSQGNGQNLVYTPIPWTTGSYSTDAIAIDINQDNHMDIIIAKGNAPLQARRENEIWTGNGDGTFYKSPQIMPLISTWKTTSGDYNGDGNIDLVFLEGNNVVRGYLNDGTSLFQNYITIYSEEPVQDVDLIDIDVDGDLDLVIAKLASFVDNYRSEVLLNDGSGNFMAGPEEFSIASTYNIEVFDIDNDNDPDLLTINVNNDDSVIWINQTDPILNMNEANNPEIKVFPNPATNFINIKSSNNSIASIILFSTLGRIQELTEINSEDLHLKIEKLSSGVYFLKVTFENGKFKMIRFIKN